MMAWAFALQYCLSNEYDLKIAIVSFPSIVWRTLPSARRPRCETILGLTVCSDEGLTLETSAKHHIPQATNIPYQPC